MDIRKSFGLLVKEELRNRCGMSQEELTMLAALNRLYIGGVERGTRNTSAKH
ncbi:hypothetical protein ACQCT6_10500 [Cytobacillus gottheilii]|uniref:hypothetical protein n=1 Tax=Cytobacillus gottheilii TaxID=859144 RepID=UPI003CF6D390